MSPEAAYCDAHIHVQSGLLRPHFEVLKRGPIELYMVSNGTSPADWEALAEVEGEGHLHVYKAYGVHPWYVDALEEGWEAMLRTYLESGAVSVGEIGLDNWIRPADPDRQREVFKRQLQLARELNLVPTIHCLQAWGALLEDLSGAGPFERGFLVHAFGGSLDVQRQLLDLGGHFSFSAYAASPHRKRMRAAIQYCPADRLLSETDAPDMVPDKAYCRHYSQTEAGEPYHHPLEIETAVSLISKLRAVPTEELRPLIMSNFRRLFALQ